MSGFDDLLSRLGDLLARAESLDDASRALVFDLLDQVDTVHRLALHRLGGLLGESLDELRAADPAVAWLFDAYAVGLDERAAADEALDAVRPYVASHGGAVEVVAAADGVVSLRMSGTCSGCTGAAATLRERIDEALRDHLPGFVRTEVEDDGAPSHPPPVGPVPVRLRRRGA